MYKILHIPTGNFVIYFSSLYRDLTISETIERIGLSSGFCFFISESYLGGREQEFSHKIETDFTTAVKIINSSKFLREIAADINDIIDSGDTLDTLINTHGKNKIIPDVSEFEIIEVD